MQALAVRVGPSAPARHSGVSAAAPAALRLPAALQPPHRSAAAPALLQRRRAAPSAALPGMRDVGDTLPVHQGELPNWLALAAYGASHLAQRSNLRFQLTAPLVFKGLALYTLVWAALAALEGGTSFDRVGSAVGPAFLAINSLGGLGGAMSPYEAAAAGFGVFMADALPAFPYSRWVWLATLAGAIYSGLAAQWLVAAFGLSAAWRLLQGLQGGSVRPQEVAFVGLAAWAYLKKVEIPVALAIMAGQLLASVVS